MFRPKDIDQDMGMVYQHGKDAKVRQKMREERKRRQEVGGLPNCAYVVLIAVKILSPGHRPGRSEVRQTRWLRLHPSKPSKPRASRRRLLQAE